MISEVSPAPASVTADTIGSYRHEAFLYSGVAEFLTGALTFIRHAVSASDPILVVVSGSKIELLRAELRADARSVNFADMAEIGDNPARILATWLAFVDAQVGARQLWGIGEPVYPGRSPTELAECQLHEALLNVAFDASVPFWLLCPYDLEALAADVIGEAHRTHPFVAHGDDRRTCPSFRPVDVAAPFARPLPARPADAAGIGIRAGELRAVRTFVADHAGRAGLDRQSADAMVLAVGEVATNSLRHGGGEGEVHAWRDGQSLVFEVSDGGHLTAPLAGRIRPDRVSGSGGGLFLVNQLCDLVQIHSSPQGTAIRVHRDL